MKHLIKSLNPVFFYLVMILIITSCGSLPPGNSGTLFSLTNINTIQQLQDRAKFSFAIISDNKGDSPKNCPQNARMATWVEQLNDQFVIGLGDHLKLGWDNSFLDMIKNDPWWNQNFYPNIADGENEYYSMDQADWGSGGELLDEMNFKQHDNVVIRKNGAEYYAKISVDDYNVHLIQLHYPDCPQDCSVAFPQDSRQYLKTTLQNITKGPKDIIIAAAHSRTGFWIDQLDDELMKIVMEKCDLVLSATTHKFERKVIPEYQNSGALVINTGSVNYPRPFSHGGYVHVSVLESPFSLIIQYIDTDKHNVCLQDNKHVISKIIGGEISAVKFGVNAP